MIRTLTPAEILALDAGAVCPRRDHPVYLADCVVRGLQARPENAPPGPWSIEAGIGRLTRATADGPLEFESAVAPVEPPSLPARAKLFAAAIARWSAKGFPVASADELARRRSLCAACPQSVAPRPSNGWLGSCRRCGCTGPKLHLATERCPDPEPRW